MNNIISIDNITFWYKSYNEDGTIGKNTAITNLSLDIAEGSFVALVGHNGSGKSTLAKLLNGLFLPKKGTVTVSGMNTADNDNLFDIRKTVGMVFQNPDNQMVASIVEEDVAFGPENLGVPQPEIVERVNTALEQVGMTEYAKRTPSKLSGGQKQRIAIAGALAIRPQVLVLDESTAMLDPQGRAEVLRVAHQLNKQGMTVVLITHFMEEVLTANQVVVMDHGTIVAQGTPDEVFAQQQLLDSVGLRLPRGIELARKLACKGMQVDVTSNDMEVLGGVVCQYLSKV